MEEKNKRKQHAKKAVPENSGLRTTLISLPKHWNDILDQQNQIAIEFYNRVLYLLRHNFFYHQHKDQQNTFDSHTLKYDNKYPNFNTIYDEVKTYEQYQQLPSKVAQNTAKLAVEALNSYKGLVRAKKLGKLDKTTKINLPDYKKAKSNTTAYIKAKLNRIEMTYDGGNFVQKGRELMLTPCKINGKKTEAIRLRLPPNLEHRSVKTITLVKNGSGYVAHIVTREEGFKEAIAENEAIMAGDLGLNNVLTLVNTVNGEALIIDGKALKSINQGYNKEKAYLQSLMDKSQDEAEKEAYFRRIEKKTVKRNRRIRDRVHKIANKIKREVENLGISKLVIGYNQGWKEGIALGKRNNQQFVQLPYRLLLDAIRDKLETIGVRLQLVEESYTSKVDHLANEPLEKQETYLGKRVKRGLFQSSTGKLINADVNGALGILRKSNHDSLLARIVASGRFLRPVRVQTPV